MADRPASPARPLIVCSLEIERRLLRRAGVGRPADFLVCGPGDRGIRDRVATLPPSSFTNRPIILAGLGGALHHELEAGSAYTIEAVLDGDRRWVPPLRSPDTRFSATVMTADVAVVDPAEKQRLHRETGADLVDLESGPFARLAASRSWQWAIVRGISDDAHTPVPAALPAWIDSRGRSRPIRIGLDAARQPSLIRNIMPLRRHAGEAMAAASERIRALLDEHANGAR